MAANRRKASVALLLAGVCTLLWATASAAQTIYLQPGVGIRDSGLLIGHQSNSSRQSLQGVSVQVNARGRIVLISCSHPNCTTTEQVSIRATRAQVRSRYGSPSGIDQGSGFEVYHYSGVSFKLVDGRVTEIHILAR